jgi:chromosome segregation ATPase
MKDKEKELDATKSEIRNLQAEVASLQRKLEVKDREIEDAKNQMRRTNNGDQDELKEELNRLQLMLFDLKTTRADLLEKLDDSQHESDVLKNQVKALKAKLGEE